MNRVIAMAVFAQLACAGAQPPPRALQAQAPLSRLADSEMIFVHSGPYRRGSTPEERERGYEDYLATHGDDVARKHAWFQYEPEAVTENLSGYRIDRTPVTQGAYAEFVRDQGGTGPHISEKRWNSQGFSQDYITEVARFNWADSSPPAGRLDHPVVLVPWADGKAYCRWRGSLVGEERTLPTENQFEKAARGADGSAYPWGEAFDPSKLNSGVQGPRDTLPVTSFTNGQSAAGAFDMAGNVFQWTSTPWPRGRGRMTVKGSAWDDFGGLGRAAAAHGRPATVAHAIVGFRCSAAPPSRPL